MIVDSNRSPGGYRPKGRPQDQELEDESGSEAEFGIQVSKSLAQEKLKALAEGGDCCSWEPRLPMVVVQIPTRKNS